MTDRPNLMHRWANRIVSYGDDDPANLLANPYNHRIHGQRQARAVNESLGAVGWITPVIVNETTGHVVDGHLRIAEAISRDEPTVPVVYVELTVEEERLAIATFDAIADMADIDRATLALNVADLDLPDALAELTGTLLGADTIGDADGIADTSNVDTPTNALAWGYATWSGTRVECSSGEVDTLQRLWETFRHQHGDDDGFVAWLASPRAAESDQ